MTTQKHNLIIGAAALAVVIGVSACYQANASDLPQKNPYRSVTAPSIWDGFFIGAHAGYGWTEASGAIGPFIYSPNPEGMYWGGQMAVQKQYGAWVFGVEASLSKGHSLNGSSGVTGAPGISAAYDIAYSGTAEFKLGLAMNRWLPHLTAGGMCAIGHGTVSGFGGSIKSSDDTKCGYTVGAGLDYALLPNVHWFTRANWFDLGSSQVSFPVGGGLGISAPLDLSGWTAKTGINFRF